MTDEGETDNDFLRKEQENDPDKIQKEAIELQKGALDFYKGILKEEKEKKLARPERCIAAPVLHAGPRQIAISIREIDNGFILARGHGPEAPHYGQLPEETYYYAIPQLLEGVKKVVEGAFLPPDPTLKGIGDLGIPDGT